MKQTVVIGGGIGGLSAALSLRAKGFPVDLFEMTDSLGGKANSLQIENFRFDTGPSLLTLPEVFDDLFLRMNKERKDYVTFLPLDPITRYWFADGQTLAGRPLPYLYTELESSLSIPRVQSEAFFTYAKKIHRLTTPIFLKKSLHEASTWLSFGTLKAFFQLYKADLFRPMVKAINGFFSNKKMEQFLGRFATYNGSDPFRAPATLNTISYVEHGLGGFAIEGGIYALVKVLEKLCMESGVTIHKNSKVQEILLKNQQIQGVLIENNGEKREFPTDIVVSDVDILTLYEKILMKPEEKAALRYKKLPPSTSGLVFYWGLNCNFPELGVNNIFFSNDYEKEFREIHHSFELPEDPTIYINITSKVTPSDAPNPGENWFVLVNAPPHDGRDWSSIIPKYRNTIIGILEERLGKNIRDAIVVESILTPEDIERNTGSWKGSLYGISSNTMTAAFNRHPNRVKKYKGLYVCGGSVHPGGGMPLVTLSGMIAADLVEKYENNE